MKLKTRGVTHEHAEKTTWLEFLFCMHLNICGVASDTSKKASWLEFRFFVKKENSNRCQRALRKKILIQNSVFMKNQNSNHCQVLILTRIAFSPKIKTRTVAKDHFGKKILNRILFSTVGIEHTHNFQRTNQPIRSVCVWSFYTVNRSKSRPGSHSNRSMPNSNRAMRAAIESATLSMFMRYPPGLLWRLFMYRPLSMCTAQRGLCAISPRHGLKMRNLQGYGSTRAGEKSRGFVCRQGLACNHSGVFRRV